MCILREQWERKEIDGMTFLQSVYSTKRGGDNYGSDKKILKRWKPENNFCKKNINMLVGFGSKM